MSSSKNLEIAKTSFLSKSNSAFIEEMYLKYINKDSDLAESWKEYFSGIEDEMQEVIKEINGPSWKPFSKKIDVDEIQKKIEAQEKKHFNNNEKFNFQVVANSNKDSISAVALIRAYRLRGHLLAKLDPLELMKSDYVFDAILLDQQLGVRDQTKNYLWGTDVINLYNDYLHSDNLLEGNKEQMLHLMSAAGSQNVLRRELTIKVKETDWLSSSPFSNQRTWFRSIW